MGTNMGAIMGLIVFLWYGVYVVQLFMGYGTAYRLTKAGGDNGVALFGWFILCSLAAVIPGLGIWLWVQNKEPEQKDGPGQGGGYPGGPGQGGGFPGGPGQGGGFHGGPGQGGGFPGDPGQGSGFPGGPGQGGGSQGGPGNDDRFQGRF